MNDEAFLRAIIEEPHDDAHRLVYADWLDEHGGASGAARAEFIRVQIERERLPLDDPRRGELHRRSCDLLDQHRTVWSAQLPKLQGVTWQRFWRGFVSGADVQAWKFYRRHAVALFAAAPVQFLRVFRIGASTCRELASSPYLVRLTSLELIDSGIGDEGAVALAASPWLENLRRLTVHHHPSCIWSHSRWGQIGDAGAFALAASPWLGRLELLDLGFNPLGPKAAQALRERFGQAVRL
jgi:uncharacterized protein (TIGR02996 family)